MENSINSLEAEKAFLGCLLLDPAKVREFGILDLRIFYYKQHELIAKAINKLIAKDFDTDLVSICTAIESSDLMEMGGPEYLADCQNFVPVTTHCGTYFKKLKYFAALREIQSLLKVIKQKTQEEDVAVEDVLINTQTGVEKIKTDFLELEERMSVSELLQESKRLRQLGDTPKTFIQPLNKLLDEKTPRKGHFWVIGAYQKVGKTTFAVQLSHKLITQNKTVRFISLEMADLELAERLDRVNRLTNNSGETSFYSNFTISELKAPTIEQVVNEIETCKEEIIFVDYLQIIAGPGSETQAMERYPMMLKNAARRADKVVIALSQIGNDAAVAPTRKKTPFKGSANIGAAADLGIVLYRDLDREASNPRPIVEATLDVVINRHGQQEVFKIFFDRESGIFLPGPPIITARDDDFDL